MKAALMTFTIPSFAEIQHQIEFAIATITALMLLLIWFRKKKPVELSYAIRIAEIIGEKNAEEVPTGMTINVNGQAIIKLVRYRYVFWNSGTNSIKDIDVKKPVELKFPSALEARRLRETLQENACRVLHHNDATTGAATIQAHFDYLDASHGFVFDVFTDITIPAPIPFATIIGTNATLNRGRFEGEEIPRWLRIPLMVFVVGSPILLVLIALTQDQKVASLFFLANMLIITFASMIIFPIALLTKLLDLRSALPPQSLRSPTQDHSP